LKPYCRRLYGGFTNARAVTGRLEQEVRDELGRNVRELRVSQGLTLAALAAIVGVSPSAISQIERGATEPSLGTLWSLGKALNASLFDFFTHEERPVVEVTRADERMLVEFERFRYEVVARSTARLLDLFFLRVAAGDGVVREPTAHAGEECGVVLEGTLDVEVAGVAYRLEQGDGIWFLSTQPHTFRPADGSESLSVWADTIPNSRKRGTAPKASIDDFLGPEVVVAIDAART
jgi:transcriptional regulator with XRE-family HTH domain